MENLSSYSRCYVCKNTIKKKKHEEKSKYSKTNLRILLGNLTQSALNESTTSNLFFCKNCKLKLDKYDRALTTIKKIQLEIKDLLEQNWTSQNVQDIIDNLKSTKSLNHNVTCNLKNNSGKWIKTSNDYESFEDSSNTGYDCDRNSENSLNKLDCVNLINIKKQSNAEESANKLLCEICKKYFNKNDEFERHCKSITHKKILEGSSYISCKVCNSKFLTKASLKQHIIKHTGEKNYECPYEGCNQRFTQKSGIQRHIIIHTGEERYQCEFCGKKYHQYSSFRRHKIAHGNLPAQECKVCGLKLNAFSKMSRHMATHTGEKPYECLHCGKFFAIKYNMISHIKKMHGTIL